MQFPVLLGEFTNNTCISNLGQNVVSYTVDTFTFQMFEVCNMLFFSWLSPNMGCISGNVGELHETEFSTSFIDL